MVDDAFDYDVEDDDHDGTYPGEIVDVLVARGAELLDAERAVMAMVKPTRPTTCCEVYGRGEIVQMANTPRRNVNLKGLRVIDLRTTKPDGTYWDLSKREDRREALRLIDEEEPDWVIVAPLYSILVVKLWPQQPKSGSTAR